MDQDLSHNTLKTRHREVRDSMPQNLSLRIHRALSWLNCAEHMEDADSKFIFLWIALNAAYANEFPDRNKFSEQKVLNNFLKILLEVDDEKMLNKIVWQEFPNSIRLLIDNQHVFQPFWDYQNQRIGEEEWRSAFIRSKESANRALGRMDTKKVLRIIFGRLYVLRNQLIHGGATWKSSVNRGQIRDGANIMFQIVPAMIFIMMEKEPSLVGDPCYPVIG